MPRQAWGIRPEAQGWAGRPSRGGQHRADGMQSPSTPMEYVALLGTWKQMTDTSALRLPSTWTYAGPPLCIISWLSSPYPHTVTLVLVTALLVAARAVGPQGSGSSTQLPP